MTGASAMGVAQRLRGLTREEVGEYHEYHEYHNWAVEIKANVSHEFSRRLGG